MVKIFFSNHTFIPNAQENFECKSDTQINFIEKVKALKEAYKKRSVEEVERLFQDIDADTAADIRYHTIAIIDQNSSTASTANQSRGDVLTLVESPSNENEWLLGYRVMQKLLNEVNPEPLPALPFEIWSHIISFIPSSHRKQLRLINHTMKEIIDSSATAIKIKQVAKNRLIPSYLLERFNPSLIVSLELGDVKVDHDIFHTILRRLVNVKTLGYCDCNDSDLDHIRAYALEKLNIAGSREVTDSGILYLGEISSLKNINIASLPKISNVALQAIAMLRNLEELTIRNCPEISDVGLRMLAQHRQLSCIDIGYLSNITDRGLGFLSQLAKLKRINLKWCEQITDIGVQTLTQNFQGPINLRPLGSELHIDVSNCKKLTENAFSLIARCRGLKSLNASGCRVDTNSLICLRVSSVEELTLQNCRLVDDCGLDFLSDSRIIRRLDIQGCRKPTAKTLSYIGNVNKFEKLETLNISDCDSISIDAVHALQKKRPDLHIITSDHYSINEV